MTIALEDIEEQETMAHLAVISSEETTFINDEFKDEISVVDIEVDELAAKLEQDSDLGRFMMSAGSWNWKAGQCLHEASIGVAPTEAMTIDSDAEVDNLDVFDASIFYAE